MQDVIGLVIYAAIISTLLSATIGTTSLLLGGVISLNKYAGTWAAWWAGDMLGDLVIAPLILVWCTLPRVRLRIKSRHTSEALLAGVLLILLTTFVFWGFSFLGIAYFRFTFIIFPAMVWIAFRFGPRGTTLASLFVAVISIWATVLGHGPFTTYKLSHALQVLQSFIGITAATFLFMTAVVAEHSASQKKQEILLKKSLRLVRQKAYLMDLNRAKDEFVAIASHQLRTPATAVKQYLGLLLEGYAEPLSEDQLLFLKNAYENNDRQLQVVDDLLTVAQLDLNKMKLRLKKQDVSKIVREAVTSLRQLFKDKKQRISVELPDKPIMAKIDGIQFRSVVDNLIENASNYSQAGAQTVVSLKKTKAGINIYVRDQGVGIDRQDFPRLFQKFSRIRNELSDGVGGTGLGLYLSQKIIELHGGRITVDSEINKGTKFTITIPSGL
jgi:signal transduction histidine kinase